MARVVRAWPGDVGELYTAVPSGDRGGGPRTCAPTISELSARTWTLDTALVTPGGTRSGRCRYRRQVFVESSVVGSAAVRRVAAVVIAVLLALLAGCQGSSSGSDDASAEAAEPSAAPPVLSLSVANGSSDLPPATPVSVTVSSGELGGVTVTDDAGAPVPGTVAPADGDPATSVWTPEAELAYGTSYTVTATATNADDAESTATSTFT